MTSIVHFVKASLVCICLICLSGCAYFFGRHSQTINITTFPPGATVYLDDKTVGKTPIAVNIPLSRAVATKNIKKNISAQKINESVDTIALADTNSYRIVLFLDGHKPVSFLIKPEWLGRNAPNRALCKLDIVASILTFGIPIIVDNRSFTCVSFNSPYVFDLESKSASQNPSFTPSLSILQQPTLPSIGDGPT